MGALGYSSGQIWLIIVLLALGTFALRFSFLAILGDRTLPPFLLRLCVTRRLPSFPEWSLRSSCGPQPPEANQIRCALQRRRHLFSSGSRRAT